MRICICAVGRLRRGPEAELVADYLERATRTGRALGLGPCAVTEIDERKAADRAAQGAALSAAIPAGAYTIALDERGKTMQSPDFARQLERLRDAGTRDLAFLIGGADGLAPDLVAAGDAVLSFGPMVWPHMLARVMLAEQLYRATSILAGQPYHRA